MLDKTTAYGLEFTFPAGDKIVGASLRRHGEFARVELDFLVDQATGSGTMVDVERVEILRGPQAAYFGRNTYAGAINIVTKTPGNEWKGQLEGERAQYGSLSVSGSVSGPIVADKLAIRVSGQSEKVGGQYTNVADGATLGDRQTDHLSASLYATPSNELTM